MKTTHTTPKTANTDPLLALLALVGTAAPMAEAIRNCLENHAGFNPDTANWGHVGTLHQVNYHLKEASRILGLSVDGQEE
jgi:hypothetical protein